MIDLGSAIRLDSNVIVDVHETETGLLVAQQRVHNRVPSGPRNTIRDLLAGVAYPANQLNASNFGIGSGTNPAADTDTALQTPLLTDVVTQRTSNATQVVIVYFLQANALNGATLTEAALLNAASVLIGRVTFNPIAKVATNQITFTWTVNVNAG